mgnify:CR=1 FL=1
MKPWRKVRAGSRIRELRVSIKACRSAPRVPSRMGTISKREQRGLNPRLVLPIILLIVVAIIVFILMATGKSVAGVPTLALQI